MYTELVCAVELKSDTPKKVIDILQKMVKNESVEGTEAEGFGWIFNVSSAYFPGDSNSELNKDIMDDYHLTIRLDCKNYGQEIQQFIAWIAPYCSGGEDEYDDDPDRFIGFMRYEEEIRPTLIFINPVQFETV